MANISDIPSLLEDSLATWWSDLEKQLSSAGELELFQVKFTDPYHHPAEDLMTSGKPAEKPLWDFTIARRICF